LRIVITHHPLDDRYETIQERLIHTEYLAIANRPTQQPANDVAATLVRRHDPVTNGKYDSPDMIGDHFQRDVCILTLLVRHTRELTSRLDDRYEQIGIEVGVHILQDRGEALQPCTR